MLEGFSATDSRENFNASLILSVGVAVFGATVGGFFAYLYIRIKISSNKKNQASLGSFS